MAPAEGFAHAVEGVGGFHHIALAHVRDGHVRSHAAIELKPFEVALAAQHLEQRSAGVFDALAAADHGDRMHLDALERRIEAHRKLRHVLGACARRDHVGATIEPGPLGPAQVDLGIVKQNADAIGDEVRVGRLRDRVGGEIDPCGRRRHHGAGSYVPANWRCLIHGIPRR